MTRPSGPLLKSILLNGGKKIDAVDSLPYDNNQGFGVMNLRLTLPLNGYNRFNLFCLDLQELSEGSTNQFPIKIKKLDGNCNTTLSITLVYNDPPGPSIMNDLDLEVERVKDGKVFYPNPIV